jgi:transcriptional regulator GlxA family with amidase domain
MEVTDEERLQNEGLKEQVAAFVSRNVTDYDLSVERLALEFTQSRRSFYRNIQAETGMTPAQFVREVRLTLARTIARKKPGINLEELTQAVGYKTPAGFKKAYQQRFGEHPLEK